jgi:hypothetical protein
MRERDIILTGIPRSGTTLVCWLLNQLPHVVALVEPWLGWRFALTRNPERACQEVVRFFGRARLKILTGRSVFSHRVYGEVPTNTIEERRREGSLRRSQARLGRIRLPKEVAPDFRLVVKHVGVFTALLEGLTHCFPTYALVRNPLSVLASWNSVALPVRQGRLPMAERLDPSLRRMLRRRSDRFERQICLLSWFFETYRRVLPPSAVLRYEDIVQSGGRALGAIIPEAARLDVPLQSRNVSPLYDPSLVRALGERLLRADGSYWEFYSREDVERLLEHSTPPGSSPARCPIQGSRGDPDRRTVNDHACRRLGSLL